MTGSADRRGSEMTELNHGLITSLVWRTLSTDLLGSSLLALALWLVQRHGNAWCGLVRLGQPSLGELGKFSVVESGLVIIFDSAGKGVSSSVVLEISDLGLLFLRGQILPWAGTPSTRPGCSKPRPAWLWTLPERGQPGVVSHHPHHRKLCPT